MRIEVINHKYGSLPIILDNDLLPVPAPNEFILSRRHLSLNTLKRNMQEILLLYRWSSIRNIDFERRVIKRKGFTEAEIKGSLIEFLRVNYSRNSENKTVSPNTFNMRLSTVKQFLLWLYENSISLMSTSDVNFQRVNKNKIQLIKFLDDSWMSATPIRKSISKSLSNQQIQSLLDITDPCNSSYFGNIDNVGYRNQICILMMLNFGLRPGELLSLKVEDIQIGAISAIKIVRRGNDQRDPRKPKPRIKRNGRIIAITDSFIAKKIDVYITIWREELLGKNNSEYLILSRKGLPLSIPAINAYFKNLRDRYSDIFPSNLSPKTLRHTFSSNIEKSLRKLGVDEDKRRQTLAYLRGDSSLSSQDTYMEQQIEEYAIEAVCNLQKKLIEGLI